MIYTMNKIRIIKDIYDKKQDKWVQAEIINNNYVCFKGWSYKWNLCLKDIPKRYIKKGFTHTKRFRPKIGDIVQIKMTNIGKENILDFKKIENNKLSKLYYPNLVKHYSDIWINGITIKKSSRIVSVLYIYNNLICILKVKRDSNIICEKNTHLCRKKNIFYDIFKNLHEYKTDISILLCIVKTFKQVFLENLKINENIVDYYEFDFIIQFIINNINYFDEDKKISFLKTILSIEQFKKRCYFELAHIYMNKKNINKKIIFRYLCLSDNTNIAVKYIQDKVYIENNLNDPIDILYDLLT